jgi:rare lipoprotein A
MRKLTIIILLLIAAMLTSCSNMHKKDGPPHFYVDETKVPNATPKVEPLAKYGNMRTYRVFGRTYHVMSSSKNYTAVGIASWYGTQFHAQRTSSGERYDMLGMTAAHKTLPLPTYVEVTNLKNHRKIIVKVNDRGPFEQNRLIDLSYVAAKKLGLLGHGTAPVKIKAIDPRSFGRTMMLAHQPKASNSCASSLYLQVGAYRSKSHAENMQKRIGGMLSSPVQIAHLSTLYHVQIGPIKDATTAKRIATRLRQAGIKSNKIVRA